MEVGTIQYKNLRAADVKNKTVLLRVDLNEQLDAHGKPMDDFRLRAIIPTIQFLQEHNAKIILCSHLGRPEGEWDMQYSLSGVGKLLAELLKVKYVETVDKEVTYPVPHLVFVKGNVYEDSVRQAIARSSSKDIILLENLRFYEGEDENSAEFAKILARLAVLYVNDAFSVSHRKSASTVAITKYLPSRVGPLVQKEIRNLDYLLKKAKSPMVLVMGGIKIAEKAKTLQRLGKKADYILVGGGLANVLFAASGYGVGDSSLDGDGADSDEVESIKIAKKILVNFKDKLILPKDLVVCKKSATDQISVKERYDVHGGEKILDIGPQAILEYSKIIKTAKTVCWNGPLGYFEQKAFRAGTMAIAKVIGSIGKRKAFTVAGGGETVACVRMAHQQDYFDHISTGGGAMLEYLAGVKLPGLEALKEKNI